MIEIINDKYTKEELKDALDNLLVSCYQNSKQIRNPYAITHALIIVQRINELNGIESIGEARYQSFVDSCQESAVKIAREYLPHHDA